MLSRAARATAAALAASPTTAAAGGRRLQGMGAGNGVISSAKRRHERNIKAGKNVPVNMLLSLFGGQKHSFSEGRMDPSGAFTYGKEEEAKKSYWTLPTRNWRGRGGRK